MTLKPVYNKDGILLYNADCEELLASLPDESIDLIATDPPFGISYKSQRAKTAERNKINIAFKGDSVIESEWLHASARKLRPGGALYLFTRWDVYSQWYEAISISGLQVKNLIVWIKSNHTAGDLKSYAYKHEFIIFATKGRHLPYWSKRQTNVWEERSLTSTEARVHPTQKPIGIMARCIINSCPEGGTVLDPFTGSGTTLIAAGLLGMKAVGSEIEPTWAEAACKRLEEEL